MDAIVQTSSIVADDQIFIDKLYANMGVSNNVTAIPVSSSGTKHGSSKLFLRLQAMGPNVMLLLQ